MTMLTPFLRKVLIADAATSTAAGLVMIGGADFASPLLGLPAAFLFWAGVSLIPFITLLVMIIRANAAPSGLVTTVIVLNFAWVAGSLFAAFGPMLAPSLIGQVFICAQAAVVLLFAELQMIGLRRTMRTAA